MKFIRYGGANSHSNRRSLAKQEKGSYHRPPERRGLYVFPYCATEAYAIDWRYFRGAASTAELKRQRRNKARDRKEIDHRGPVWHHLGATAESMGCIGSWTIDRVDVYEAKLRRRLAEGRRSRQESGVGFTGDDLEVFLPGKI